MPYRLPYVALIYEEFETLKEMIHHLIELESALFGHFARLFFSLDSDLACHRVSIITTIARSQYMSKFAKPL